MSVNFRVNSCVVDTSYLDNSDCIGEIISFLRLIKEDPSIELLEVSFCGAASPEGSDELNFSLAAGRLAALEEFVRAKIDIPEHLITRKDSYIPWDYLKLQVEFSDLDHKHEILSILNEKPMMVPHHFPNRHVDHRIIKLKQLHGGLPWIEMYQLFFEHMRNAYVVFVTRTKEAAASTENSASTTKAITDWTKYFISDGPQLRIKTNALGWTLGILNAAVEVDVARHLSVNLPVYYSAWNYFKSTIKFRCLLFQPELRYWVDGSGNGFYTGAHFGVSSYNFAFDGDYRFQDRNGVTPAFGGGVSLGYRIPLSANGRWQAEFSLGAGVYSLNFDVFKNTENVKEGVFVSNHRMTYVGLDQASVSFSYSFDLKKKGGKR